MVKMIKSWEAEDGSLHRTECDAATRDVTLLVQRSPLAENSPYSKKLVMWLCENAPEIRQKLEAHEKACPQAVTNGPYQWEANMDEAVAALNASGEIGARWLAKEGFTGSKDFRENAGSAEIDRWMAHHREQTAQETGEG